MTERRILKNDQSSNDSEESSQGNQIFRHLLVPNTIFVPIYVRGFVEELVEVSLDDRSIKAKFQIYLTIPNHIDPIQRISVPKINHKVDKKQPNNQKIRDHQILKFIQNNFILECGGKFIKVIEDNRIKINDNAKNEESSDQEDEDTFNQQIFVTQITDNHSNKYISYLIRGVFCCQVKSNNFFFPIQYLVANLNIEANTIYFEDIVIRFNFMSLSFHESITKQFCLNFRLKDYSKFGIYSVDSCSSSIDFLQKNQQKIEEQFRQNKGINFRFAVFSLNIPFILRIQIPIWIMCFASLFLFSAPSNNLATIYANAILFTVSYINLMSNFRCSKFSTSLTTFYEIKLGGMLTILIILVIKSTNNFYNSNSSNQNNTNWEGYYISAISVALFLFFVNIISLLYFIKKFLFPSHSKNSRFSKARFLWDDAFIQQCQNLLVNHQLRKINVKQKAPKLN